MYSGESPSSHRCQLALLQARANIYFLQFHSYNIFFRDKSRDAPTSAESGQTAHHLMF